MNEVPKPPADDDLLTFQELEAIGEKSQDALRYHHQKGKPKRDPRTKELTPGSGLFLIVRRGGDGRLRVRYGDFKRWKAGEPLAISKATAEEVA